MVTDSPEPAAPPIDHRRLAVALYNRTWQLLERTDRSLAQEDEMIATAHASAYHWLQTAAVQPKNVGRSHWLCARVYAQLGMPESASHHAARYLDIARTEPVDDWDLAAALESAARAAVAAGRWDESERLAAQARDACLDVSDVDDRDVVFADLDSLPRRPR